MNAKPKKDEMKLVVASVIGLANSNERVCKSCSHNGCTDRGYILKGGDTPLVINELLFTKIIENLFAKIVEENKDIFPIQYVELFENQCVRELKKSNIEAIIDRINLCNGDCHRNKNCAPNGVLAGMWKERGSDYHCPFRGEDMVCQRNEALDHTPLICKIDDEDQFECEFHEEAFRHCFRRAEGKPCYDLTDKFGVMDKHDDHLLLLAHRFSAAPCQHCVESVCNNKESIHFEKLCVLNNRMEICEHYEQIKSEQALTEGICTWVNSKDGKDDRKILPSSDYVNNLSKEEANTLCIACRISHGIAKFTGLKCLGVRRSSSNPFLNANNPLYQDAIQVNYLFLTNSEDGFKYNPALIAEALHASIVVNCEGMGCDEIDTCNIFQKIS